MELLNVPVAKTSWPKSANTGKAHVLTSAECLKALKEKKKAEEKEEHKQEWLSKKQI